MSYEESLNFYRRFFNHLAILEVNECLELTNEVAKHHRQIRRDKAARLENLIYEEYT